MASKYVSEGHLDVSTEGAAILWWLLKEVAIIINLDLHCPGSKQ